MPTYEYECSKCKHTFEKFQSITSKPAFKCPKCGKRAKRMISVGGGIIFKGSGFYQTDYRSKEYTEKAKKESEAEAPKEDKKTETKSTDKKSKDKSE